MAAVKRKAGRAAPSTKIAKKVKAAAVKVRQRVAPKKAAAPILPTIAKLEEMHPDAHCELVHANAFQLIVATVLSAQTTDVMVNKATPKLFERFPDAAALAAVEPLEVEPYISTLGFFRMKSKSIVGLARKLQAEHRGEVPRTLAELVELPGVGRKTANVVLGVAFHTPEGVVVDTHVQRISQRLKWTRHDDPIKIEQDLMKQVPREKWDPISHLLIFHGRRICFARKPNCEGCGLNTTCPSAFRAEKVGRKPPRVR